MLLLCSQFEPLALLIVLLTPCSLHTRKSTILKIKLSHQPHPVASSVILWFLLFRQLFKTIQKSQIWVFTQKLKNPTTDKPKQSGTTFI